MMKDSQSWASSQVRIWGLACDGMAEAALHELSACEARGPQSASLRREQLILRALILEKSGQHMLALAALESALAAATDPRSQYGVLVMTGSLLEVMGRTSEARNSYWRGVEVLLGTALDTGCLALDGVARLSVAGELNNIELAAMQRLVRESFSFAHLDMNSMSGNLRTDIDALLLTFHS